MPDDTNTDQDPSVEELQNSTANVMSQYREQNDLFAGKSEDEKPEDTIEVDDTQPDPETDDESGNDDDPQKTEEITEESDLVLPDDMDEEGEQEDDDSDGIEEPEGLDDKASEAFKSLRQQVVELKKQVKDGSTAGGTELQKQLDEANDRLMKLDLQNSPYFKNTFVQPIMDKAEQMKSLVRTMGMDEAALNRAAQLPLKERMAFVQREFDSLAPQLNVHFSDLDQLQTKRTNALAEAKQTQEAASAAELQLNTKTFDTALEEMREGSLVLTKSKNDKWNTQVSATESRARDLLSDRSPESMAKLAIRAATAQDYEALYKAEHKLRLEAEEGLQKRSKAVPKVRGKAKTTAPKKGSKGNNPKGRSGESIAKQLAGNLGK